jgi:hypothetical protein
MNKTKLSGEGYGDNVRVPGGNQDHIAVLIE